MSHGLRRVLIPALAVLALIAVVAVAAGGSVAGGSSRARQPPQVLFDTVYSLFVVALIPGAILLVYGLMQRKDVSREYAKHKRRNSGLIALILLTPLILYLHKPPKLQAPPQAQPSPINLPPGTVTTPTRDQASEHAPQFAWIPVAVILLLVGVAALAWYLRSRRRPGPEIVDVAESLADVLDDTVDDLRAEADPRRAVIAAYASLERALARHGFPRRASETPDELLERVLDRLEVSSRSIGRLTELYERARFSQHEVDDGMKEEAIEALEDVRDELRASSARDSQDADDGALAGVVA